MSNAGHIVRGESARLLSGGVVDVCRGENSRSEFSADRLRSTATARSGRVYDVAVVGAGIVGLSTALVLARQGYSVALVERSPPGRVKGELGFDIRTVALTPASVSFLHELDGLEADRLSPIEAMRVWEFDGAASLHFRPDSASACPPGLPRALAYVAENSAVTKRLWTAAGKQLDIHAPTSVTGLVVERDAVRLDGPDITARLVVAADGTDSLVGTMAGVVRRVERGRGQHAIATVARATLAHGNTAYQRFGRSGPVALLPLNRAGNDGGTGGGDTESNVAVIWSTSAPEHERLKSLGDEAFMGALGRETEDALGPFEAVDRRIGFSVRQSLAADFNPMDRVLVVGDAARTMHPLAGQGVNVGLEDARAIGVTATGADLGAPGTWRVFARERRLRSKLMIAAMRTLLAAYSGSWASNAWVRLARNTGIRWIDSSSAAKSQLVREAMGLGPLGLGNASR